MTEPHGSSTDVVIVGNGVIALATALEIKRRSPETSVTLVGPSDRPGCASSAAGAMLGCFGEVTKYTLASGAGRARFAIAREAAKRWPVWLEELDRTGGAPEITTGTTVILNSRGGRLDSENFAAMRDALDEFGEPYEEIDESDIRGFDPIDDARPLAALHIPEGSVEARRVLSSLEAAARAAGVQFINGTAVQLLASGGRVTGMRLADGAKLSAGLVVVASGAFSSELLESVLPARSIMPVVAGSGVAVETRRVLGRGYDHVVRTVNRAGSCGLHIVPLGDTEYIGATNVIFRRPETAGHLGVCHFLIQSAIDQLDRDIAFSRVVSWRIGNRPVSLDSYPVVGWTAIDRLYVVTGTYRDGFHGAPVYAAAVADEVLDGMRTIDPRFVPDRAFISDFTVEESIAEFTHQGVSSWFESGLTLPRFNRSADLRPMFEAKAREVYERLETNTGLPPDLLTYLAVTRKDDEHDIAAVRAYFASGP